MLKLCQSSTLNLSRGEDGLERAKEKKGGKEGNPADGERVMNPQRFNRETQSTSLERYPILSLSLPLASPQATSQEPCHRMCQHPMDRPRRMQVVLSEVGRHGQERIDLGVVSSLLDVPLDGVGRLETGDVGVAEGGAVEDEGL